MLLDPDRRLEGGGVLLRRGRVERVLEGSAAVRRARSGSSARELDLGDVTLAPGLVNAHAHLELSALSGRVAPAGGFTDWIGTVLRERAELSLAALERGLQEGARRALESGTTAVGEIDSSGLSERRLARGPLRVRLYRELLDARDAERTPAVLARARAPFPRGALAHAGLSPHAPHTTSAALLDALRPLARRAGLAWSVHWAESEEEARWLAGEPGPFDALLGCAPCGGLTGLEHLTRAGLVGSRTSLVHANHPAPGERERVRELGATVVHCPGSHAFFGRAPFPISAWLAAGVPLALGTDSLASNADLDMRREMALLRDASPALAPREVWAMATLGGARALALEGRIGRIAPGTLADLAAFETGARELSEELEILTAGRPPVRALCVGGRWMHFEGRRAVDPCGGEAPERT